MRTVLRRLLLSALVITLAPGLSAQESLEFYPGGTYDPNIPTPENILGYAIGTQHTPYHKLDRWLGVLTESSDRVSRVTYGESFEGRELTYLVITSPENQQRLDEIKDGLALLADPRRLRTRAEVDELLADLPAVVWLAYTVHGNEASGTEAAIQFSYQLAAGTDSLTLRILDQLVVIVDPLQNPDGHERFVHWVETMAGVVADPHPAAIEHSQPWPGGRTNHYLFDLNRDWFLLTQPETEGKVKAFLEWHPQVLVDLHEMGSNNTYFFAPPMPPVNQNVPETSQRWWEIYGKANAEAFDAHGWPYYVRESFDEFYPGYGVSWPTLTGAIGMTYEQASSRGRVIRRDDESLLTLGDGARHHFTTSLATCRVTAENRLQRLRDYYDFRRTAVEEGESGPMREILLVPQPDPATAARLVRLLIRQGIEVRRAREAFRVRDPHPYPDSPERREFPPGTYLISLAQPQKRLIKAILEPEAALPEEFIREERRRRRAKERSRFYDITAWSLPLTMGVEAYWSSRRAEVVAEPLTSLAPFTGRVIGGKANYAYVFRYQSNVEAKALSRLLQTGVRVHVARKAFRLQGEFFPAGSFVIWAQGNPSDLFERLTSIAEETGADFYSFDTGWVSEGINLGSPNVRYIRPPKIAVAADEPTNGYSVGALRYLFDQHYGIRATFIRTASLGNTDLKGFDVLILPDSRGPATSYQRVLGSAGIKRLSDWIRAGGVLIAIKGGARFATTKEAGWSTSVVGIKREADTTAAEKELPPRTPGAILRVNLSPNHPLCFGYGASTLVLVNSELVFQPSREGQNVAVFATRDSLRVSGFVWEEGLQALAGTAYLIDESLGSGRVILFADDPNFRASWDRLTRLFLNAIFLGPNLRS